MGGVGVTGMWVVRGDRSSGRRNRNEGIKIAFLAGVMRIGRTLARSGGY
jgi:hypothetical protein